MNPASYGPTGPHLWLVGKIPPNTWDKCPETSERKAPTHSYDDLIDLLMELTMERENDCHMDKCLRKHVRRKTPAEKSPRERSPQPHSHLGKGRGGQLNYMKERPPCKGKGAPILFYFRSTDGKVIYLGRAWDLRAEPNVHIAPVGRWRGAPEDGAVGVA